MSIDLEDFEFAVADRFPAAFPRGQTARLATSRALVDYLAGSVPASADTRSIKQHAFYRIRALLARQLRCGADRIRPDTPLEALLPEPARRRQDWATIRAALAIAALPRLRRSARLEWSVAVATGAAFLITAGLAARHLSATWAVLPAGALGAAASLTVALRATERRATHFQTPPATVGDLAAFATAYGSPVLDPALTPSTRPQILEVVRELIRLEIGSAGADPDATWQHLAESAQRAA